jgi:hypothetical protein
MVVDGGAVLKNWHDVARERVVLEDHQDEGFEPVDLLLDGAVLDRVLDF